MDNQQYKCPLCGSILVRDRWVKIVGQWENLEKERARTKKLLKKSKKEREEVEKKYKKEMKKTAKEAEAIGVTKGVKKEKSLRERMAKMLTNKTKEMQSANKKILELEKQIKAGITPQVAGFDYEKEVQRMLTETFPEDRIKPTGKKGDILQFVIFNKHKAGSILYECKKTDKYSNQFINEVRRHQEIARADHAVIVTHAAKEGKSKFFIERNVIVIDPLGLLDVAFLLRSMLIDIHKMKLTKKEAKEKGLQILRYMQSGDFRNNMLDTIDKSRQAHELLVREVKDHNKAWVERIKLYSTIHNNTQNVRKSIGEIITGGSVELENYPFASINSSGVIKLESGSRR